MSTNLKSPPARWCAIFAVASALLGATFAHAVDYSFGSVTIQSFTINASDVARDTSGDGTFDDNSYMGIYWRGSASDNTHLHFDLLSLQGTTINGVANLNYTIDAYWGGNVTGSQISTANSAWAYSAGGATPAYTTISGAPNATGSFSSGQVATWGIGQSTFQGYVNSQSTFHGLVLSGASAPTTGHFTGTPTLTGTFSRYGIQVTDGTDWSAATFDNESNILSVANGNVSGGNVTVGSGIKLAIGGASTLGSGTFSGTFANAGALAFGSTGNQTLSGGISGSGVLEKSGSGSLTLTGGLANTFSGPVTVNGGRLIVSDAGLSLKNTTGAITVSSGASFYFAQNFTSNNLTNALTLSGEGNGAFGALHLDFNVTSTGAVTLAGDATIGHDWNGASIDGTITGVDRNLTLASNIAGQGYLSIGGNINLGTGSLIKKGVNGVLLNGTNTFGSAVIQSGLLIFQNHAAIGGSGANITIQADGVAVRNGTDLGTLLARVNPASTGAVAFGGSFTTASTALDLTNHPMLSIGSSVPMIYSGIITPGGGNYRLGGGGGTLTVTSALTGANGLIINDAQGGTVILSGVHTYTGATVVNSGTLRTDGTFTGAVSVSSGGTLAPGPASGIGSFNLTQPLTVTGALQMRIDRAGSQNSDRITAPSVTLGGSLTVVNAGAALQNGDTFQLFSVSGNITQNNAALTLPTLPSGLTWYYARLVVDGTLKVVALTNTIGDPNWPSQLTAQLQAVYDAGYSSATINPGTYNMGNTGFHFNSWTNFTIDATGIIFVVGSQRAFTLENCINVTVRGAVIRAMNHPFTQGSVLEKGNDSDGTAYAVWRVSDGYPDTFTWWFNAVDQTTRKMDLNTGDLYYNPADATYQSDRKWKLRFPGRTSLPFKVNDWLVARGVTGQDSAVFLAGCRDCTVQSVTSQGGGYATLREIGGGGNRILGCRIEPSPDAPPGGTELPVVSCAADGIHSALAYPGPHIEDFVTEGVMLDDCIAIRGTYATISEVAGNTLVMDHSGQCVVSDPVRISNPGGFFAQATCTAIVNLSDGKVRITLDQTLPVPVGSTASNPKYNGSGFRIINCRIGNTRSNAMIIKADDGLISGTTISHSWSAISFGPGWNESDYSWNNTVANNLISDCDFGINMNKDGAIGHRNLSVIDNSFSRITRGKCISIDGCDGITLTGNSFDHHGSTPAISLKMANNIQLANNLVDFAAGTATELEIGTNVTNLSGEANGIFHSGRSYALTNVLSSLLLDNPGNGPAGTQLRQSAANAATAWVFQPTGDGYCRILSAANNGLAVGVNNSASSGAPLALENVGPSNSQLWKLTPVGTTAVKLVNQLGGLSATVLTTSQTETVTQLAATSNTGQHWTPRGSVYWGSAGTVLDDSDIVITGQLLYAEHWGGTNATVNGVPFTAAQQNVVASPASGNVEINADIGAPASLSTAYKNILKGNWWTAGDGSNVTLRNLQLGKSYLVQIWSSDPRYSSSEVQTISGGPSLNIRAGQYVTGSFMAEATTQVIQVGGGGILNAFQVREVSSVALVVTNATTSSVSSSVATITPDGNTPAMITVTLKNAIGFPVSGKIVTLSSSRGALDSISPVSATSDASGRVSFTVTSTTVGNSVFTATAVTDGNLIIASTVTLAVQLPPPHAPQASPNPIVFNQDATTDNLVVLMAAASEYSEGLSLYWSGAGVYPKHFWITHFNNPYYSMKWDVSLATGGAYRVYAKLSSGATVPLKLTVENTGTALSFSTRSIGWDQLDAGIIQIPSGTSTLALRRDTTSTNNVDILSLELIRESDRPAYEQRVANFRADTTWLSQAKYGLMTQYGTWGYPATGPRKSLEEFANGFDVPAFVSKVKTSGASYVIWSLTWWEYRMLAPIQAVDNIEGNGDRTSSRDVIGELATALQAEGLRFILYYHTGQDSHLGYDSTDWWTAQQWPDQEFTERGSGERSTFFNNWVNVITEVGNRYGTKLDGFIFDDGIVYYPAPFERLGQAAKAGNPNRLISYNPWISARHTDFQEVEFGEGSHGEARFGSAPVGGNGIYTDGPYKGLLQHGMFTMEQDWGIKSPNEAINTQITPAQAIGWVQSASSRNVPVSFNMMFREDQSHSQASMDVLATVKAAFRSGPPIPVYGENLIVNGGFENPDTSSYLGIPPGSNALTGWEILAQPSDGIQLGEAGVIGPNNGTQTLQLTGATAYQNGGGMQQFIATTPGDTYRVRCDLASRSGSAVVGEIAFGSERHQLSTSGPTYLPFTMEFTATASSTALGFNGSTDSASHQLLIDNVFVFAVESNFARWQSANFSGLLDQPAISGPLATPAGDAMPNLLKYAFGLQPMIPATGAPVSLLQTSTATIFRYQRPTNRPDLVYLVETSSDLTTWNSASLIQNRIAQTSGMETWEIVIPETDPQPCFMRVKVTNRPT